MFRNALATAVGVAAGVVYLLVGLLAWVYDSLSRDNQPIKCCICKQGEGIVVYRVRKSLGRSEQAAFCRSCIEGLSNAGDLS